jgi:hypothetical protein
MASGGGAAPGPALAPNQGGTGPVIVFDWDCTITCKHMFKVLAGWPGYWCARRLVPTLLRPPASSATLCGPRAQQQPHSSCRSSCL